MSGLGQDIDTLSFENRLGKVERDQDRMRAVLDELLDICESVGREIQAAHEYARRDRHGLHLVKGGQS